MHLKSMALIAALLFIGSPFGWGQVVDTGSETGVASKEAGAGTGKTAEAVPVSSAEEERSRALLQLKAQRAGGKFSKGDPQLAELEEQISALQQQIAENARGIFSDEHEQGIPGTQMQYPRIVQPQYAETSWVAAVPAQRASFTVPSGPLTASANDSELTTGARQALQQSVSVAVDQTHLSAVLDSLANQSRANIYVNWAALQTAGVDRATPVTLNLSNVACSRVLRAALDQAGGSTASLSFTIDEGVIVVSTKDDLSAAKYQSVRVYNIRDLLAIEAQYPTQLGAQIYANHLDNIMDTIKSVVAPDSWRDNGGIIGSIRELDGLLIVNQTADNHASLEQFLAKIRSAR